MDSQRLYLALPPVLAEFADIIGVESALKLARIFGGGELYVPKRIKPHHPIAQEIGMEAAQKLAKSLGGLRFKDFANAKHAIRLAERDFWLGRVEKGEVSLQQAARELGVHTRHLRQILSERRPRAFKRPLFKRQMTLFDWADKESIRRRRA